MVILFYCSNPYIFQDAPDMMDDFYLNLLEWGPTGALVNNNILFLFHLFACVCSGR